MRTATTTVHKDTAAAEAEEGIPTCEVDCMSTYYCLGRDVHIFVNAGQAVIFKVKLATEFKQRILVACLLLKNCDIVKLWFLK